MSDSITSPSMTKTVSSTISSLSVSPTLLDQPRVDLTQLKLEEMTDDQLEQFVKNVRERRTSQQLALENKPSRRGRADNTPSVSKTKQLLSGLLTEDDEP